MSSRPKKPKNQQASRPRPASPKKPAASSSSAAPGGSQPAAPVPAMHKSCIKETRVVAILFAAVLLVTQS
ncbi:MAG: hypothetical protein KAT39_06245, partial [Alphaproteobacteria bacterium]|nr:hypothetical protein [Alphaproteobacteria bacterium]